jgi:hypothetical protein
VAGLLMGATRSIFWFCGGTPPQPPPGGFAPLDPHLPTIVGLGFASVLPLSEAERGKRRQIFPFSAREGGQVVRSEGHITHAPWERAQSPPPSV